MIVTRADEQGWTCLARRGMLHSECEAVDLLVLEPGETLSRRGRDGIGEIWYVIGGNASTVDGAAVTAGAALVITPDDTASSLTATDRTSLLTVSTLGDDTVTRLPRRRPDLLDQH
ncbi:cupin domain-containing protein [Kutzneria sp. NPDC052558]|uniref:cupin domain-containing protein n=1 Tax=Kutzneria sp. NPDC052558 TaxID=3364121 RepID=UPI0037C84FD8